MQLFSGNTRNINYQIGKFQIVSVFYQLNKKI